MSEQSALPRKTQLWNQLKKAREAGVAVDLEEKPYVSYTEAELQTKVDNIFGAPEPYTGNGYSEATQSQAGPARPQPKPAAPSLPTAPPAPAQSAAPAPDSLVNHPELWGTMHPRVLAEKLGVPFEDRGADRAGLTQNTHGPNDPLRVDSLGRVWFVDEVSKPAIPQPRMVRNTKSYSSNVEVVATKRPDGGLDETFEIAGAQKHEITVRTSMPTSQVGIYRDPRFPFKLHQYGGRRGFDYEEVMRYYGGLDLLPTAVKEGTLYIDRDLCFDINKVRDSIERELRERSLGRSAY